jgi:hypothetical protein
MTLTGVLKSNPDAKRTHPNEGIESLETSDT